MNHIIECESENSLFNSYKTIGCLLVTYKIEARLFRGVLLYLLFERKLLINFMGNWIQLLGADYCMLSGGSKIFQLGKMYAYLSNYYL